jgi:hypothetical protein
VTTQRKNHLAACDTVTKPTLPCNCDWIKKQYTQRKKKRVHRHRMKYWTLHRWVRSRKLKPEFCVSCRVSPPVDIANISGNYKVDLNDFEWLCRKCQMEKDGRSKKLASMSSHKGTGHCLSRLVDGQVIEIRRLRRMGFTYSHIAKQYRISVTHAHRVAVGKAWKHLNGKVKP